MKDYNIREFKRILMDNGWVYHHQTGDHEIWYKNSRHMSVPLRKKNPMLFRRLIRENGIKLKEVH